MFSRKLRDVHVLYNACRNFRASRLDGRSDIKVILGASDSEYAGWISTNIDILDVTRALNWRFLFERNSISAILAEHVWEHLSPAEAMRAAKNCHKYLKKGGHLRIAVPDGFHPEPSYIDYVKPGGTGIGSDTHKQLFNYVSLESQLKAAGFDVELLEYWDEKGHFHHKEWKKEDGFVLRSMKHDKRNQARPLSYTSLIVDGKK